MKNSYDLVIVGGGIVGLAAAWAGARRSLSVLVVERSARANGATVRNFGMVWPIGQPSGEGLETALRSRELWLEAAAGAGFWSATCGSLHLARRDDEAAVLHEFLERDGAARAGVRWMDADEASGRSLAVRREGLLGALWSPHEVCVDPREVPGAMAAWLADEHGVDVAFGTAVARVGDGEVVFAGGGRVQAGATLVCSGAELGALFPDELSAAPLVRCKLQMMRTAVQPDGWRVGPHLAGGLTLRHYAAFEDCPTLPELKARVAREQPELDELGIHVMASQNGLGEVVLGDSHEYGDTFSPDSDTRIDELVLIELQRFMELPDWKIAARWSGVYVKCTDGISHAVAPVPGVHVLTGLGGAGMTLSFGLAERFVDGILA